MVDSTSPRPATDAPPTEALKHDPSGVWVVIAAYNEQGRLGTVLSGLQKHYPNVVVVDDGSRDRTSETIRRHPVWLLRHVVNRGQGAALQTGISFALARGAQWIVTFDADGQHSVEDIPKLLAVLRSGRADAALGSRFLGETVGLPFARWVVLKLGVVFTQVFSRIAVTDTHNGLRAFSRAAAEQIKITHDRMAHASEIIDQVSYKRIRYEEVPVTIHYRADTLEKGQSSWNAFSIVGQLLLGRLIR